MDRNEEGLDVVYEEDNGCEEEQQEGN
jgi:hypothetical protein